MKEKFIFRIISQLSIFIIGFLSSYFLILMFEVELIGLINFASSFVSLFSLLVGLSFPSVYFRYNKDKDFDEHFTYYFFYNTVLIIANFLPLYIASLFIFDFQLTFYLLLILTSNVFSHFTQIFSNQLISKMKIFKTELPAFILSLLGNLFRIFIALNVSIIPDPLFLLGLNSVVFALLKILIVIILSRGEFVFRKFRKGLLFKFLKDIRPLMIAILLGIFLKNLGNVFIGVSFGYEALAYYYIVENVIINFLLMISGSIQALLLSFYSSLFQQKKIKEINRIANRIEKFSSILLLFIAMLVLLNGDLIFQIFLPKYLESIKYLSIMIFIPYFAGINRPYSTQLIPGNRIREDAIYATIKKSIILILIIIIVPTDFFLIPMLGLGAIGLSIIKTFHWGIDYVFYRYFSKKFFSITRYNKIFVHIIISILALLIGYLIKSNLLIIYISEPFLLLVISSTILLGLYFGGIFLLKELNRNDIKFIISLFKFKSYKDSFLDEIRND